MSKKRKSNQPPKTQAERRSEFRKSRLYNSTWTPLDQIKYGIFINNLYSYRRLVRFGLNNFDEQGRVLVKYNTSSEPKYESGKDFLEEVISYFEQKDKTYAYRYCAELKELLTAYHQEFGS